MVVGGGPAGLKAAATAGRRGHDVTLYEAERQLGGQALLAQLLPRRTEFGGIVTNLSREVDQAQVRVQRGVRVDRALVERERPDAVILAAGATPYRPAFETDGQIQVIDAWEILRGTAKPGRKAVVVDWRSDWIGPGIAEKLVREGTAVELAVNNTHAGALLPLYVRDELSATLHRLGVPVIPYARLYGTDGDTVYLQHTVSEEPIVIEGVDTLVLCLGHQPEDGLYGEIGDLVSEIRMIGDCLAPRTAEEAVYDGLKAGVAV